MKRIFLIFLFFVLSASICAQRSTTAIKVDQFDLKAEGINGFEPRAEAFLKILAAADKTTRGLVTIYDNEEAAAKLKVLLAKDPKLPQRVAFFKPGVRYPKESLLAEFWLVPEGADEPYTPTCAMGICECASISIEGPKEYSLALRSVDFTAEVAGATLDSIEYLWKVEGGKIVKGQGTSKIKVKPIMSDPRDITATLEIKGPDPSCNCPTTDSSTARYHL